MGYLSDRQFGPNSQSQNVPNAIPLNTQATPTGPLPATLTLVSSTETLVPSVSLATVPLSCALGPDTPVEQTPFDICASGTIKSGSTSNMTLKLYEGLAIASGNLLGSSGAIAQNGTGGANVTRSWWAHATGIFDSVSGELAGKIEFYLNRTLVATATFSNFVVGPFLNVGNPSANPPTVSLLPTFVLSATSSGATSGTGATVVNVQKFSCG
jgi:hypothetical protein